MKIYLTALSFALLSGCVATPVDRHWPKVPDALQVTAPELKTTSPTASAAEVFDAVIDNYGTYYEVADKLKGWQQWYVEQQKIFESVK